MNLKRWRTQILDGTHTFIPLKIALSNPIWITSLGMRIEDGRYQRGRRPVCEDKGNDRLYGRGWVNEAMISWKMDRFSLIRWEDDERWEDESIGKMREGERIRDAL